jgi:DNA modification methylase
MPEGLFDFQRAIVQWACRRGRAAIFADTGLGKTAMQLAWANNVPGDVLIVAPLAVAQQTMREGVKFGINATYRREPGPAGSGITITNYEMLARFDVASFAGIVLDESSILKSHDGKTRTAIIEASAAVPYRLSCTATPSPNDYMELGNQCEFLGVMSRVEMLATFFIHDGGDTSKWRLKGHGRYRFWEWMASWAVVIRSPADIGYDAARYDLPPLLMHEHVIADDAPPDGELFARPSLTLGDQRAARRKSLPDRVAAVADKVNGSGDAWLVWCNLNDESSALARLIPDAVSVSGSDSMDAKEAAMAGFSDGSIRVLISKPSICGFGMNWQHCHNVAFCGLSHSFEQMYQAIRRCWRFGQTQDVNVHIVTSEGEGQVLENIRKKSARHDEMSSEMVDLMHDAMNREIQGATNRRDTHMHDHASGDGWDLYLGDCVDVVSAIPDESVGYTVFSPPFSSLYTYSASDRDMGNCRDDAEFAEHFRYLIPELFRVTQPGRLLSFHCMNLPSSKQHHGYIGLRDFRGDLIRAFQDAGWIFHSEVCIWKDPVTAMQRTKALGLLHKQLKKDSAMSRQGIPDYLVTMRKPGENPSPISHTNETFPVELWQKYASPVWMDINQSRTLQYRHARENDDERHIAPLQLGVIERAIDLWSAAGDLVLSPFAGIGSEGFVALGAGRRFIGAELKESYWRAACDNLAHARSVSGDLFAIDALVG